MTGQVIHGKFEILDEIGHGGMGVVYRARQISLDRIVALKMLSANLVEDKEFRERFRQEAKIIARLTHPNIIHVYDIYDVEEKDGWFCIVMEFLEGRSLREVLRESGRLPVERAIGVAEQMATGLAYAHSEGIIHRDVKPDNIMMLRNDQVKIMDFGIAQLRGSTIQTQTGVSMGTPQFMSPEQAAGKTVDARSDLYSLSVVIYAMVTGQLPFSGDSPVMIALKHIQEPPPRPSQINPAIPPALDLIILKGMAKRPEDRYQSADEFRKALSRFGAATAVTTAVTGDETQKTPLPPVPMAPPVEPSGPWDAAAEASVIPAVRRRINWGWVVAALPGLIALAIVLFVVVRRPEWIPWQRTPAEVRALGRGPFEKTLAEMRSLKKANPEKLRRLLVEYEPFWRRRALEALQREMRNSGRGKALDLRREIEEVILPYLTDEQEPQWLKLGPQAPGGGPPPWRRPGRPERAGLTELLSGEIDESPTPNPSLAQRAFGKAKTNEQLWERSATSATLPSQLFLTSFWAFQDSIYYNSKNWTYHWEFSQFLTKAANQAEPTQEGLRSHLLQVAADRIDSATALCRDPAQKGKMAAVGDALRRRLPPMPPAKPGSQRSPLPPGIRERIGRSVPEKP